MKSKEIVPETSQGAGSGTEEGAAAWEGKILCRKSGHRLGVTSKFSLRDVKVSGETASEV